MLKADGRYGAFYSQRVSIIRRSCNAQTQLGQLGWDATLIKRRRFSPISVPVFAQMGRPRLYHCAEEKAAANKEKSKRHYEKYVKHPLKHALSDEELCLEISAQLTKRGENHMLTSVDLRGM